MRFFGINMVELDRMIALIRTKSLISRADSLENMCRENIAQSLQHDKLEYNLMSK
jgi:hypothetical protein